MYDKSLSVNKVEIDGYLPLSFKSYEDKFECDYLRLGDFKTSLLELLLDPVSKTVRGVTLTFYKEVHHPRFSQDVPVVYGLPTLLVSADWLKGTDDWRYFQVMTPLSVGFGRDFIEIDLGQDALKIIRYGSIEFYINGESLVGLRITGLSAEQLSLVKSSRSI
jgi:hypothetical protein